MAPRLRTPRTAACGWRPRVAIVALAVALSTLVLITSIRLRSEPALRHSPPVTLAIDTKATVDVGDAFWPTEKSKGVGSSVVVSLVSCWASSGGRSPLCDRFRSQLWPGEQSASQPLSMMLAAFRQELAGDRSSMATALREAALFASASISSGITSGQLLLFASRGAPSALARGRQVLMAAGAVGHTGVSCALQQQPAGPIHVAISPEGILEASDCRAVLPALMHRAVVLVVDEVAVGVALSEFIATSAVWLHLEADRISAWSDKHFKAASRLASVVTTSADSQRATVAAAMPGVAVYAIPCGNGALDDVRPPSARCIDAVAGGPLEALSADPSIGTAGFANWAPIDELTAHSTYFCTEDALVYHAGGAERYLVDLAHVAARMNLRLTVLQHGDFAWARKVHHVDTVSLRRPGISIAPELQAADHWSGARHDLSAGIASLHVYSAFWESSHHAAVPNIGISHGVGWDYPAPTLQKDPSAFGARVAAQIRVAPLLEELVSVDTNTANWLQTVDFQTSRRVQVIPNYADLTKFKPRPGFDEQPHVVRIGYPRRMMDYRGKGEVLKIIDQFLEEFPNTEFWWVGRGPPEDEHEPRSRVAKWHLRAERLHTQPRMRFYKLDPADMPIIYRQLDVSIIPTQWSEGTSLSCIEAMASGNAVISSRVGGLSDLVIDGFNGYLTGPSGKELLEALRSLMRSGRLSEFKRNSVRLAKAFSRQHWVRKWETVLEAALGRSSVRRDEAGPLSPGTPPGTPRWLWRAQRKEGQDLSKPEVAVFVREVESSSGVVDWAAKVPGALDVVQTALRMGLWVTLRIKAPPSVTKPRHAVPFAMASAGDLESKLSPIELARSYHSFDRFQIATWDEEGFQPPSLAIVDEHVKRSMPAFGRRADVTLALHQVAPRAGDRQGSDHRSCGAACKIMRALARVPRTSDFDPLSGGNLLPVGRSQKAVFITVLLHGPIWRQQVTLRSIQRRLSSPAVRVHVLVVHARGAKVALDELARTITSSPERVKVREIIVSARTEGSGEGHWKRVCTEAERQGAQGADGRASRCTGPLGDYAGGAGTDDVVRGEDPGAAAAMAEGEQLPTRAELKAAAQQDHEGVHAGCHRIVKEPAASVRWRISEAGLWPEVRQAAAGVCLGAATCEGTIFVSSGTLVPRDLPPALVRLGADVAMADCRSLDLGPEHPVPLLNRTAVLSERPSDTAFAADAAAVIFSARRGVLPLRPQRGNPCAAFWSRRSLQRLVSSRGKLVPESRVWAGSSMVVRFPDQPARREVSAALWPELAALSATSDAVSTAHAAAVTVVSVCASFLAALNPSNGGVREPSPADPVFLSADSCSQRMTLRARQIQVARAPRLAGEDAVMGALRASFTAQPGIRAALVVSAAPLSAMRARCDGHGGRSGAERGPADVLPDDPAQHGASAAECFVVHGHVTMMVRRQGDAVMERTTFRCSVQVLGDDAPVIRSVEVAYASLIPFGPSEAGVPLALRKVHSNLIIAALTVEQRDVRSTLRRALRSASDHADAVVVVLRGTMQDAAERCIFDLSSSPVPFALIWAPKTVQRAQARRLAFDAAVILGADWVLPLGGHEALVPVESAETIRGLADQGAVDVWWGRRLDQLNFTHFRASAAETDRGTLQVPLMIRTLGTSALLLSAELSLGSLSRELQEPNRGGASALRQTGFPRGSGCPSRSSPSTPPRGPAATCRGGVGGVQQLVSAHAFMVVGSIRSTARDARWGKAGASKMSDKLTLMGSGGASSDKPQTAPLDRRLNATWFQAAPSRPPDQPLAAIVERNDFSTQVAVVLVSPASGAAKLGDGGVMRPSATSSNVSRQLIQLGAQDESPEIGSGIAPRSAALAAPSLETPGRNKAPGCSQLVASRFLVGILCFESAGGSVDAVSSTVSAVAANGLVSWVVVVQNEAGRVDDVAQTLALAIESLSSTVATAGMALPCSAPGGAPVLSGGKAWAVTPGMASHLGFLDSTLSLGDAVADLSLRAIANEDWEVTRLHGFLGPALALPKDAQVRAAGRGFLERHSFSSKAEAAAWARSSLPGICS